MKQIHVAALGGATFLLLGCVGLAINAGGGDRSGPAATAGSTWKIPDTPTGTPTDIPTGTPTGAVPRPLATATQPAPTTRAPVRPTPKKTTPKKTPRSVYYASCAQVRAAGAAPLHRGEPGYRAGLDRDNDGTACDTTGRR